MTLAATGYNIDGGKEESAPEDSGELHIEPKMFSQESCGWWVVVEQERATYNTSEGLYIMDKLV